MKILRSIAAIAAAAVMLVFPVQQCGARYIPSAAAASQSRAVSVRSFDTEEAAADYVRDEMRERKSTIVFSCNASYYRAANFFNGMLDHLFNETGRGADGDYLRYGIKEIGYQFAGNDKTSTFTIEVKYLTTAAQESYVDQRIRSISDSLGLGQKSDYDKISTIYDWIVKNVSYADDTSKNEVYSAYGALYNGKAVCQGFAQLFYRLAMESGISCRIIAGTAGGANHAWVIAAVNGSYYLLDPTWDSYYKGNRKYYFMKGTSDFDSEGVDMTHVTGVSGAGVLYPDYTSAEFKKLYPIQSVRYAAGNRPSAYSLGDINGDGTIDGSDATMVLRAFGQFNSYGNSGMPALQRLASDVNGDGVIDGTDATIILKYFSYVLAGHNISFKDFMA